MLFSVKILGLRCRNDYCMIMKRMQKGLHRHRKQNRKEFIFYDQIYDRCIARAIADFRRERRIR